jgi:hypothetical protein
MLKTEFVKRNKDGSHIHEIIPTLPESLSIDEHELKMLHKFAESNSIYSDSYEMEILDTICKVYQGDVNNYWLDSIKHDTTHAPFYPIWILSAYALALESKSLGARQIIDIGSGDGRIAYCGKVVGLESYGIEIDDSRPTTLPQYAILPSPEPMSIICLAPRLFDSNASAYAESIHIG